MTLEQLGQILMELGKREPNIAALLDDSINLTRMSALIEIYQQNHDSHEKNAVIFNDNLLHLKEELALLKKQLQLFQNTQKSENYSQKLTRDKFAQDSTILEKSALKSMNSIKTDLEKSYQNLLDPILSAILELKTKLWAQEQTISKATQRNSAAHPLGLAAPAKSGLKNSFKIAPKLKQKLTQLAKKVPPKITKKK